MAKRPATIQGFIRRFYPCSEARKWLRTQPSLADAWKRCPRSDWLGWVTERVGTYEEKKYLLALAFREIKVAFFWIEETQSFPEGFMDAAWELYNMLLERCQRGQGPTGEITVKQRDLERIAFREWRLGLPNTVAAVLDILRVAVFLNFQQIGELLGSAIPNIYCTAELIRPSVEDNIQQCEAVYSDWDRKMLRRMHRKLQNPWA